MFITKAAAVAACLVCLAGAVRAQPREPVLIFAAASLKEALDGAASAYRQSAGVEAKTSYAGSFALARQLEQGAPADIFIAADEASMDYAVAARAIRGGTRFDFLGNSLVVVAEASAPLSDLPLTAKGFASALGGGRMATGDVQSVPAGKYAMAALRSLGLWDDLRPRLAMSDNVRAALAFVARGEAPLGIVYATDAAQERAVKIVATFPPQSHPPIVYPLALTARSRNPEAAPLLAWLRGPEGAMHFEKRGFIVLK